MAETYYTFGRMANDIDEVFRAMMRDCHCVRKIDVVQDPMGMGVQVRVQRADTGIWEWNDEMVVTGELNARP